MSNKWWRNVVNKKPKGFINIGVNLYEYETDIYLTHYNNKNLKGYRTIIPVIIKSKVNYYNDLLNIDNDYIYDYIKRTYDVDVRGFDDSIFRRDGGYFPYVKSIDIEYNQTEKFIRNFKNIERIKKIKKFKNKLIHK